MVKKIAVTGGKGGTGKTLMATNIAVQLYKNGNKVLLIDCDTENPNTNILLGKELNEDSVIKESVEIFTPKFDDEKCIRCGKCQKSCYRHAILQFSDQLPSVMEHMCSGCETCLRICPTDAISDQKRVIGHSYFLSNILDNDKKANEGQLDLLVGELMEGEAVSVLVVEDILEKAYNMNKTSESEEKYDYFVIDTSPGAHCDVEQSLESADAIVAVTEPTPFGQHDLKRILDLIEVINRKATVILNRANLTNYKEEILKLTEDYGSEILGEIPISNIIIEDYAKGIPFSIDERDFPAKHDFINIFNKIGRLVEENEKKEVLANE